MSLDWVIVGGGIHGAHIAARLLDIGGCNPSRLRIVDPGPRLLDRWWKLTEVTGMTFMRSTSVHHLDADPHALRRFARDRMRRVPGLFAAPYARPSLELFRAHTEHVIERTGLAARHVRGDVVACEPSVREVLVRLASGAELRARRVVLALGAGERVELPAWAATHSDARIQHVFQPDFDGWPEQPEASVAVIGGGITAAQVALRLVREGKRVHLIARHALRARNFDADPGWFGPKFMRAFERTGDFAERRAKIAAGRHRGSIPPDVLRSLRGALQRGSITWHESDVVDVDTSAELRLRLRDGTQLQVQRVLLATGYSSQRPGGKLVDDLARRNSLPCAPCGFPVVDAALRWHPRIHVSGALAELELGPIARNIAGAQRAGERILAALSNEEPVASVEPVSAVAG